MEAERVVEALFAAFAARDPARIAPLVHPDCTFWPEGTTSAVGRSEPYSGPDGLTAYLADTARAWDNLEVHPDDIRAAGNGVVCFGVAVGRLRGGTEELRIPVIWVFRLREGRVVFGRVVRTASEAGELAAED